MNRYEYRAWHPTEIPLLQELNKMGQEGWEVCGVDEHPPRIFWLKRVIQEPAPVLRPDGHHVVISKNGRNQFEVWEPKGMRGVAAAMLHTAPTAEACVAHVKERFKQFNLEWIARTEEMWVGHYW